MNSADHLPKFNTQSRPPAFMGCQNANPCKHERSEMTHTPGPWRTYRYGDAFTVGTPEGDRIADNLEVGRDNGEANARLIAAAPALLEALKALRIEYARTTELGLWRKDVDDAARHAIALAKGEEVTT